LWQTSYSYTSWRKSGAVTHNKTGLLVEPGDHISLAEAIKYLIDHPDLAKQMGELGRARIESEFNMQTIASRYVDLWQKVRGKKIGQSSPSTKKDFAIHREFRLFRTYESRNVDD